MIDSGRHCLGDIRDVGSSAIGMLVGLANNLPPVQYQAITWTQSLML